jgi:class 3 adenylate cyclase
MADSKPMDFPKPPQKQPLSLPSRPGMLARIEEREAQLKQGFQDLMALERQLEAEREEFEEKRAALENRSRAVVEAELLLKNQRMLHQKQISQLMEQKDLTEWRAKLEQQEDDLREKEAFLLQTEKRLGQQLATRELELSRREAWISAEHEKAAQKHTRRLQAVVFTDVVGFSALMQTDESRTIQRVRADLQRMQDAGRADGGTLIGTMGDGMLMIFPSALQAVRFAFHMQRNLNRTAATGGLQHRFGVHIADVAPLADGGIAGDGVNIAARLEAKAPNGGICLSEVAYFLVKGKLALPPSSVEKLTLKNIVEPVAVYKFTPDIISAMPDYGTTPPGFNEERTTPPFPVAGHPPEV